MINSHKEFVKEVLNWGSKIEFVNDSQYLTDIGQIETAIDNLDYRGFIFSPVDFAYDDDYNNSITYGFSFVDKTTNDVDAVVTSEQENLFCVSALSDFINRIQDGHVDFESMTMNNNSNSDGVVTSVSGQMTINIKRTASYWKVMEQYDSE